MNVIRDCLDKQVVDTHGAKLGRVDGIVMNWEAGRQPSLSYIELGSVTRAYRISKWWGRFVERLLERFEAAAAGRSRISWRDVTPTGNDVTAAVDAASTPALKWERWLRANVIGRIPGA